MSRAWTSEGFERGDLLAWGSYASSGQAGSSVALNTGSLMTGVYCLGLLGSSGAAYIFSQTFGSPNAEVFVNCRYRNILNANFSASPGDPIMAFYSTSTLGDYLTIDNLGILRLVRGDGTVLATASSAIPANADNTYLIQCHLLVNAATGAMDVKVDGVTFATVSGVNTVNGGISTIDRVKFLSSVNFGAGTVYIDDGLANINDASGAEDGYAGDSRFARIPPAGAGTTTQLTSGNGSANWQNAAPVPPSNSTTALNFTSTPTDYDTYSPGTPSATIASSATIVGVSVDAQARTLNAPQTGKLHVNTHSIDYASAAIALQSSYGRIANRWRLNPNTGVAWTYTEATTAEMGAGLT